MSTFTEDSLQIAFDRKCQAFIYLKLAYDNLKQRYNELEKKYKMSASTTKSQIPTKRSCNVSNALSPSNISNDETDINQNQPYDDKLAAYEQIVKELKQNNNELQEQNGSLEDHIRIFVENDKEFCNQTKELEMRAQRKAKYNNLEKEQDNELTKHCSVSIPDLQRIASNLSRSEQEMKNLKERLQEQNQMIRMLLARYRSMNLNTNSQQSAIQFVNDINNFPDAVGDFYRLVDDFTDSYPEQLYSEYSMLNQ